MKPSRNSQGELAYTTSAVVSQSNTILQKTRLATMAGHSNSAGDLTGPRSNRPLAAEASALPLKHIATKCVTIS